MRKCPFVPALFMIVLACTTLAFGAALSNPGKKSTVYRSRGQAAYSLADRSNSQKQAIRALLTDGVSQAIASLTGSAKASAQSRTAKEKILRQPERYVESYRIISEGPSKGIYRVAGEVTINTSVLKKELGSTEDRAPPPNSRSTKPLQKEERNPAPAASGTVEKAQPRPPPSRGIVLSKPSLFWAVTEKWEVEWVLPSKEAGQRALFARNLLQEAEGFDWTLQFPEMGKLSPDSEGNLSLSEVTQLAVEAGSQHAVVGRVLVELQPDVNLSSVMAVNLHVIEVATGKALADIHQEASSEPQSLQESSMKLAESVAYQLDRALPSGGARTEKSRSETRRSAPIQASEGSWVLTVRGDDHFAAWEGLHDRLRDHFEDVRINSVDVTDDETRIALDGIEETFFNSIEKDPLPRDLQLRLESISPESREIVLSVQKRVAAEPQVEPRP